MPSVDKEEKSDNPFTVKPQKESLELQSFDNRLSFRQSRNLTRFLTRDKEEEERLEYLVSGEIMHNLLSQLTTGKELEREMKKMQFEGLISTEKEYNNIKGIISRAIAHPKGKEWLDRYVYSNLAHQGGKIEDKKKRYEMYNWLDKLEFDLLELPKADIKVFLHMPYEVSCELKKNREEKPDQHELSKEHLLMAENAYKEIAEMYEFKTIECSSDNKPRLIEDINDELYVYVKEGLSKSKNKVKNK